MTASERLSRRLRAAGIPFAANDSIAEHLLPGEGEEIEANVAAASAVLLKALVIDPDHNTEGTARRIAKMFVREVFAGRYTSKPCMTDFPNARNLDEIYSVGPVTVRSTCSHHFAPIMGQAWIGIIPSERVIGLSKFSRLTEWVMARPQIQEEAVVILADEIEKAIAPRGLALVVKARHMCMTWRGVREHETTMANSVMRGFFRDKPEARAEFMAIIQGQGFQ